MLPYFRSESWSLLPKASQYLMVSSGRRTQVAALLDNDLDHLLGSRVEEHTQECIL